MPEIDRDKLSAKLDTIPQQDREPYLQALKAKGYTWKTSQPPGVMAQAFQKAGVMASQFGQGATQGFKRQETPSTSTSQTLGQVVGRYALPVAGGMAATALTGGGALPAIAASALGSAGGEAYGQLASRVLGGNAPQTPKEAVSGIAQQAGAGAAGEGVGQLGGAAVNALKAPAARYISSETGVKLPLVQRALKNIGEVFSAPAVKDAGEGINAIASTAGIKTGNEGYAAATASLLGKKASTDEFSTSTTLKMAKLARTNLDNMSPQEMYSTAEGLRKAMAAPKYQDPHGPLAQNFRLYTQTLKNLEDKLEKVIPGYADARMKYAQALSKEAFSFFGPLNKQGTPSVVKNVLQTAGLGVAANQARQGDLAGSAEALAVITLMSPLLVGYGIRAGSALKPVAEATTKTLAASQASSVPVPPSLKRFLKKLVANETFESPDTTRQMK